VGWRLHEARSRLRAALDSDGGSADDELTAESFRLALRARSS
jgi:hypothetical protein